jgi:hypothetical protein
MNDLRPLIPRNETNGIALAESTRDSVYTWFEEFSAAQGVELLILKSPPYNATAWVAIEAWLPAGSRGLTERVRVEIDFVPKDFCRWPLEVKVTLRETPKTRVYLGVVDFTRENAAALLNYLLRKTSSREFGFSRCRVFPLQFWRPLNKPAGFNRDVSGMMPGILLAVGFVTIAVVIGIPLIVIAIIWAVANHFRVHHVLSGGKPLHEPRSLRRMDSWQAFVIQLGSECDAIHTAILEELRSGEQSQSNISEERIWYWGVDGKEERQQTVVSFRRAVAFMHLYSYGKDLFVGWDAHVNCGVWIEQRVGAGVDRETGKLCEAHTVAAGWRAANEYDVTDANCLIERVHAAITRVVKHKLAEHRLDQEIDFKIFREHRQGIASESTASGPDRPLLSVLGFRRKA